MTTSINIETIVAWGPAKRVETKFGERMLRVAQVTPEFWDVWRSAKDQLKAAGVSASKSDKGEWRVCWWQALDPVLVAREAEAKAAALAVTRATDADIDVPRPPGLEYRGYQKAGVQFALNCWKNGRGVLIADVMGLGKTIQVIGLINSTPEIQRVLVCCPNTLKGNWSRELRKWLTRPMKIGVQKAGMPWIGEVVDIVIINYDIVHKFRELQIPCWDLRVTDESHYLKNPKARRTKETLATRAWRKASLTGTPIENRPVELWPIISDLDPQTWDPKKGFFRFAKRFCAAQNNGFGWDFKGSSNTAELQYKLRSTCFVGTTFVASEYGPIEIRNIERQLPLRVWSTDPMGRVSLKSVLAVHSKENRNFLVEIRFADRSVRCTEDHRIFTQRGYVRADEITIEDHVCLLRKECDQEIGRNFSSPQAGDGNGLLYDVRRKIEAETEERKLFDSVKKSTEDNSKKLQAVRTNVLGEEPTYISGSRVLQLLMPREMGLQEPRCPQLFTITRSNSKEIQEATRSEESGTSQKNDWSHRKFGSATANVQGTFEPMEISKNHQWTSSHGETCPNAEKEPSQTERKGALPVSSSSRSQGREHGCRNEARWENDFCRYSHSGVDDCNRSRWAFARISDPASPRQEQGPFTEWVRVLGVESVEVGHRGKVEFGCEMDLVVWDIEVADNHNFFANGILVHNCMIRRLKEDVLKELPPKRRQIIELEGDGRLKKQSAAVEASKERLDDLRARVELARASDSRTDYEAAVAELEEGQGAAFAEMSALRLALGLAKLEEGIEFIKDALESSKCVVFGHHLDVIHRLKEAFPQAAVITGETKADDRMRQVDRFQEDPACNVFLGNNAAAEGITLTAATHVIIFEGDWVPGKLAQKEDRCHRIGQKDSVLVTYLVVDGTLDCDMIKANVEKLNVIDAVLDKVTDYKPTQRPESSTGETKCVTRVTFETLAKEALSFPPEACAMALDGMRRLAGVCDGAVKRDEAGFSGVDARIGHSFAGQERLSQKQAVIAAKMCRKYRRQLGVEFVDQLIQACGGAL